MAEPHTKAIKSVRYEIPEADVRFPAVFDRSTPNSRLSLAGAWTGGYDPERT
jgi:hypothetical protein